MLGEVFRGLWVTIKHSVRARETVQYPEVREELPPGYRGLHKLLLWEDGLERCVGCKLCAAACPVECIFVESGENNPARPVSKGERYARVYEINELRCIFCGYCEEACPVGAIVLGEEYEFCADSRQKFIYGKRDLLVKRPDEIPELQRRYNEKKLLTYV
ncbi:MAG: NADH-quinone oxidoreductase subunit I [Nitrospinota bacterium]|jgi:NADH-quinone oxidoreductase subunit I|nr:NADH-quinone oxidoreductase subunit I [Nitrospinota bacterium]MDP6365339.1 NADH-quinone oxidoreductase subunit I [Nitrospinota bacterium]MDP7168714.1 NADH-quinone oxidoreductase subunit I [Nitrospinota bacterium]MDP7369871.1 NADH-quinone oxidoreductase subunit I [Nitrospinota bacterium]MDP7504625.1 NADH-quinone oxidoreductase subunit I [Nitrospinota bacterium]